jgi:hypothetical protein
MFGPIRTFMLLLILALGTYLGLMIERTRLSPSIDRICSNPDIKSRLSDFDRKLVCKDYQ